MAQTLRNGIVAYWDERENGWGEANNKNHLFVNDRLVQVVNFRLLPRPFRSDLAGIYSFIGSTGDARNSIIHVESEGAPSGAPAAIEGALVEDDGRFYCFDNGKWRRLRSEPQPPFPGMKVFVDSDSQYLAFSQGEWRRVFHVRPHRPTIHLSMSWSGSLGPRDPLGRFHATRPFVLPQGCKGSSAHSENRSMSLDVLINDNAGPAFRIDTVTDPYSASFSNADAISISEGDVLTIVNGRDWLGGAVFCCNLIGYVGYDNG